MHIRLELKGKVLYEVDAAELKTEVVIGRSSSCAWRTPDDDGMVGSRHARLYTKRGRVWLEDLESKNGTWYRSKKIKQKKLAEGDRINIGACVLIAEKMQAGGNSKAAPEILVLTGAGRGQRKPVQGPLFTIGSDPKASLLFLDDLVSRQHATITVKEDGSCWLKDCNSKNGTKVNDLPLRPDQERVLKDGDRVAVAHLEFSFYDGISQKIKGQALRRLAVLALTVALAVGCYFVWQIFLNHNAEWYYKAAEAAAAKEQFSVARKCLDAAVSAFRYDTIKTKCEILRSNLDRWETVLQTWQQAKLSLERGQWEEASRALGLLQTMAPEAWMWGTTGDLRAQVLDDKNLLDSYLDARNTDVSLEALGKQQQALSLVLTARHPARPYLDTLYGKMREQNEAIKKLLDTYRELDQALNELATWDPPPETAKVKEKIRLIYKRAEGPLKDRAEKLLGPVEMLDGAFQQLVQGTQLARQMRFQELARQDLKLPSLDSCSIDSRLSKLRHSIEDASLNMKAQVASVGALLSSFTNHISMTEALPAELAQWQNEAVLGKVLACDCLQGPYPRRSRKEPKSEYDRFLCVEYFYGFLRSQSDRQGSRSPDATPFVTVLNNTLAMFDEAVAMQAFFERPENLWLREGQLGQVAAKAKEVLQQRELLIQRLLELAKREKGRSAVIAAGIALHLADNPGALKLDGQPLKAWLAAQFNVVNQAVDRLMVEYESASLQRRVEIPKKIIEIGLPGNPSVNSMWQQIHD